MKTKKKGTPKGKGQRGLAHRVPGKEIAEAKEATGRKSGSNIVVSRAEQSKGKKLPTSPKAQEEARQPMSELRELKERWTSLTAAERGVRINKLLPKFSSQRALAKAVGKSEARIRQSLKKAEGVKIVTNQAASEDLKAETPAREISPPEPLSQSHHGMLQPEQVPPKVAQASEQRRAGNMINDKAPAVQPLTQIATAQERVERPKAEEADSLSTLRKEAIVAEPVHATAGTDYAIKDIPTGGEVLFAWIRANVKPREWDEAIADFKTAYWLSSPTCREEVTKVGTIPAGLTPDEVIKSCLTSSIKKELVSNPRDARRKWFACWTSILLPDIGVRRDAAECAQKLLNVRGRRWDYLTNSAYENRPTPCLRSNNVSVADFLERLPRYLNAHALLDGERLREVEVAEALKYAAATLREGSPPGLD